MKIFIKYKTDGCKHDLKFLDTDLMYYFNGNSYKMLHNWYRIIHCIQQNYPIIILNGDVEHPIDDEDFVSKISFVINPSSIAVVFPMIEEKVETPPNPEVSDLVDTYVGSTNKDGLTS